MSDDRHAYVDQVLHHGSLSTTRRHGADRPSSHVGVGDLPEHLMSSFWNSGARARVRGDVQHGAKCVAASSRAFTQPSAFGSAAFGRPGIQAGGRGWGVLEGAAAFSQASPAPGHYDAIDKSPVRKVRRNVAGASGRGFSQLDVGSRLSPLRQTAGRVVANAPYAAKDSPSLRPQAPAFDFGRTNRSIPIEVERNEGFTYPSQQLVAPGGVRGGGGGPSPDARGQTPAKQKREKAAARERRRRLMEPPAKASAGMEQEEPAERSGGRALDLSTGSLDPDFEFSALPTDQQIDGWFPKPPAAAEPEAAAADSGTGGGRPLLLAAQTHWSSPLYSAPRQPRGGGGSRGGSRRKQTRARRRRKQQTASMFCRSTAAFSGV
jgi:hypothetical protein